MDSLTHIATALFLSRAGLNRYSKRPTAILVLAGLAPDIDLISAGWGTLAYLHYHRHLTHSLIMIPVIALLPVVVVRVLGRRPLNWAGSYLLALVGVTSHVLLDWTNIYGVRLLLPFSGEWFRLDSTAVIDLWIWAAMLVATAGPLLARLVGSEIGARPRTGHGRGFARFALAFLLLYDGARWVLHQRAAAILESRVYAGGAPLRVAALPSPAAPWRWRGLVETQDGYSVHEVDLRREFDPAAGRAFYKPEPQPALEAARGTATFQEFLKFSQYPLWRAVPVSDPEGGMAVEAMDMRFGTPQQPGFVATAILDSRLQVRRSWFTFGAAPPR